MNASTEEIFLAILEGQRQSTIQFETLKTLLIVGKFCTVEDIEKVEQFVEKASPSVKAIDEEIKVFQERIAHLNNIKTIYKKAKEDPESLTEEEKKQIFYAFSAVKPN